MARATWMGSKYALDRPDVEFALAVLGRGGLVVYPTETLYGLGTHAASAEAVARLTEVKKRPPGQGISVAVSGLSQIEVWARVEPAARNFIGSNLPGPYTVILPARDAAPRHLVTETGIAFRIPRHPVPALLTKLFGPITATSANVHGGDPPVDVETARAQLGEAVDVYIDAGPCELGLASTVVDFTAGRPKVIRPGAVPKGG